MSSTSSSRRMTRSQTSSVLGKRPGAPLSRSPSIASLKPTSLMTPDSTPDSKRPRTSSLVSEDPSANKENVPPVPEVMMETPVSRRLTRRVTMAEERPSATPMRDPRTPRRQASEMIPAQTPTTTMEQLSLQTPPPSPPNAFHIHIRARACLRATSNSTSLSMSNDGREKEEVLIRNFLSNFGSVADSKEGHMKSILYISGSPGTGKTALVNSIMSSLRSSSEFDVKMVFLNCMAFQSVDALWDRLREEFEISSTRYKRSSSKKSGSKDTVSEFLSQNQDHKYVIILDELDHLSTISATALQPLFKLAVLYPECLRIIGIANTHTLTSSSNSLPFDSTSTSNVITVHFAPYTPVQLQAILKKRLISLSQDELKKLIPQSSMLLLTKKVAALTGDVRVVFEVLRGAIDAASPPSSSSSGDSSSTEVLPTVTVTPTHILMALKSYTPSSTPSAGSSQQQQQSTSGSQASVNSEIVSKVHNLNLQQRVVIMTLLLATKRICSGLHITAASPSPSPATSKLNSSPTKRSPMKRTQSSFTNGTSIANDPVVGDASSGIEVNHLFAFYIRILQGADTFGGITRSEFTDVLAVLETTGLVSLSRSSARSFKRSSSFSSKTTMSGSGQSSDNVKLQGDVREAEVSRGLGLDSSDVVDEAMEENIRDLWRKEQTRIRKEKDALMRKKTLEGRDVFDDAVEG